MKRLFVLYFISLLIPVAKAQKYSAAQTLLENKCEHVYIPLLPSQISESLKSAFPFRNIEVVDYRPDSSRIGLFVSRGQQHDLLFKSTTSNTIGSFLNEVYTNPLASKILLVVIRKLWLSDIGKQPDKNSPHFKSRIRFRAETYLKENEGYIPLAYYDTLITSPNAVMEMARFRLPTLIGSFMEKLNSLDMNAASLKNKRLLSYSVIDSFSNKNFSYPMDTANTLSKGAYATFEDFRNNKPSVFNYEIQQEENSAMTLHLKDEQGKLYISRKMWGFCDGEQTYVMLDGNLFPILPYERAYYIYGSKEYIIRKNSPTFFLFPVASALRYPPVSQEVVRNLRFFGLDMETGEIF